jgi:hypothetical protein
MLITKTTIAAAALRNETYPLLHAGSTEGHAHQRGLWALQALRLRQRHPSLQPHLPAMCQLVLIFCCP